MTEKELIQFCHYYKGQKENPYTDYTERTLWVIERIWVEKMLQEDEKFLFKCLDDYIDYGLREFEQTDDTPATLKAVLFNRLMQYDERIDVEAFKKFYRQHYK